MDVREAANINAYLLDAPDVFISSRSKPLFESVPSILLGNKPTDGGNFLLEVDEKDRLLKKEPKLAKFVRRYVGSVEFINNRERFCLWLAGATPEEILRSPELKRRVQVVRLLRLQSTSSATRKAADTPNRFFFVSQPQNDYLLIPQASSESRTYIPIGFMSSDVIASNAVQIVPSATLYHFGVLTSSVHNAWMRAVCGRLKSDYRYSNSVVYNNFPWPAASAEEVCVIEATARTILAARAVHTGESLAALYHDVTMPSDLRAAHRANDRAVLAAYGWPPDLPDEEIVARLMALYSQLTSGRV